jgi:hypothetical protein
MTKTYEEGATDLKHIHLCHKTCENKKTPEPKIEPKKHKKHKKGMPRLRWSERVFGWAVRLVKRTK